MACKTGSSIVTNFENEQSIKVANIMYNFFKQCLTLTHILNTYNISAVVKYMQEHFYDISLKKGKYDFIKD